MFYIIKTHGSFLITVLLYLYILYFHAILSALMIPYIANCLRGKVSRLQNQTLICWITFAVGWQSCIARPIVQVISLEKFHGTNQSAKTGKLFHLERFAIYGIKLHQTFIPCYLFNDDIFPIYGSFLLGRMCIFNVPWCVYVHDYVK